MRLSRFLLLLFLPAFAEAQPSFFKHFQSNNVDFVNTGIENSQGDFLFAGYKRVDFDSIYGVIMRISGNGDTSSYLFGKPDTNCRFMSICQNPDLSYNLTGTLMENTDNPYLSTFLYFWFVRLKPDLTIDFEKKTLLSSDYLYLEDLKALPLSGNRFLTAATAYSVSSQDDDIFICRYKMNGDIEYQGYINHDNWPNHFTDIDISPFDSTVYIIGSCFAFNSNVQLLMLDQNYTVQQITQFNPELDNPVNFNLLSSSRLIICGQHRPLFSTTDTQLTIQKQSNSVITDSLVIGYPDSLEIPAFRTSIIRSSEQSYIVAGTITKSVVGNLQTTLIVLKIDTSLNIIWQRFYPVNLPDYYATEILKCSDGGILIHGLTFTTSPPFITNLVVFKLNQDGLFTGTDHLVDVPISKPPYPNPFMDEITIEPANNNTVEFELYSEDARLVFSQKISSPSIISLSFLPEGMYYYRISQEDKVIQSNKIIKIKK
jgi:hypothetical protein